MCGAGNDRRHYSLERLRAGRSSRRPGLMCGARRQAFPEVPRALFLGSTADDGSVAPRTIDIGLRMKFVSGDRSFLTSPVQSLCRRPASAASTECAQQPSEPGARSQTRRCSPTVLTRRVCNRCSRTRRDVRTRRYARRLCAAHRAVASPRLCDHASIAPATDTEQVDLETHAFARNQCLRRSQWVNGRRRAARRHHLCLFAARAQRVGDAHDGSPRLPCDTGITRTICALFTVSCSDLRSLPCSCWARRRFWLRLLKNHRPAPA